MPEAWRRWLRTLPGRLGRRGVLFIDCILARHYQVEIFADDPKCILRASLRLLDEPVTRAGGTVLRAGDKLIELHFWNEHLPLIGVDGADLAWGRRFIGQLIYSLRLLAAWAATDPRCTGFVALHGQLGFLPAEGVNSAQNLAGRFGFVVELRAAPGLRFWTGAYWAGLYSWWLMWTFNPNTLRMKRLRRMALSDLWMTRETLMERYGAAQVEHRSMGAYSNAHAGKPSATKGQMPGGMPPGPKEVP